VAFDDIVEDTTDKLLLLNVLHLRDKVSLRFADIPSLNESIQQTTSFTLLDFMSPPADTTVRGSATLSAIIQINRTKMPYYNYRVLCRS
jgi:hypothetical protein